MTITDRDPGPTHTFLSLLAAAGRFDDVTHVEADVVFFVPPPTDEPLTCSSRTHEDVGTRRLERTVDYVDAVGRRVAQVFVSGSAAHPGGPDGSDRPAGELVRCVVDSFGVASVRRFRMRIGSVAEHEPLTCSMKVLQQYRTDHEPVQDVAVSCTDRSGSVVARAWATVFVAAPTAETQSHAERMSA